MTLNLVLEYLPYIMIGLGTGYLVTLGVTGGPTSLDHAKHDLAVKKEWIKMLGEQKNVRRN
jgi:hypothetical protein